MKVIQIEETIYHFPTSWAEIKLANFQKVNKLILTGNDIDDRLQIISSLSDIPVDKLMNIPYTTFNKIYGEMNFINDRYTDSKIIKEFELNGITYIYADKLSAMTTAEYIDLDSLLSDKNYIDNLHMIMAILYRPKTKKGIEKYNSNNLDERAELFRNNMKCDAVLSAVSFSLALDQACKQYIQDCSNKKIKTPVMESVKKKS